MGILQNENAIPSAAGGFYDYQIEQSCRFSYIDNTYLTADFDGNSGQTAYTMSCWFKRANLAVGNYQPLLANSAGWANNSFQTDNTFKVINQKTQTVDGLFRDTSSWYNIIVNQTATQDTVNVWVNGVSKTVTSSGGGSFYTPMTNVSSAKVRIGYDWSTRYLDGYLAEVILVDGSNKANTDFGTFKDGVWIPIEYSGSFGTDGFHLKFQNASALGDDSSGNNNDFTATNMNPDHQVADSPTFGS